MQDKIDHFSKLLRELEAEIGTRDVAILVYRAFTAALKSFKADSFDDFLKQFKDFYNVLSNTEPKFAILTYHFGKLICAMEDEKFVSAAKNKWRFHMQKLAKEILKDIKYHGEDLIKFSEKINVEGKTILVHDHSHTVRDVLTHYKKIGKNFKVVVAEQDFDKTHDNIEYLFKAKIPFQVVPSYMLSHIHDRIDMLFFGALTLKDTMTFVMDPGTHGIISEFHVAKIPVHMFMDTDKFSFWKSKKRGEIFIHSHTRAHHTKPIEYERIKYSHDRVPSALFTKIVTDKGVFEAKDLKEVYKEKMDICKNLLR